MRPGFGQIERVDSVGLGLFKGHDLHRKHPARMLATPDRLEQVAAVEVSIASRHGGCFGVAEELHALVGMEVILDPEFLALGINPHICVRAIAVHMPPGPRQSAFAHQIGHLMRALWIVDPEIPLHVIVAQARIGKPLLTADKVRELHRVANEEDWRVIADQVVIAFTGVEFQREATHVAPGVGAAHLTGYGRKARQHLCRHTLLEQGCFGIGRNVLGGFEYAERPGTLGVWLTLRHLLSIEMSHLLEKVHVVQQDWTIWADAERITVAWSGTARTSGRTGRMDAFRTALI